jgi:hypothetical protein
MTDAKWDKPRDILEDMLEAGSNLTASWPHIADRELRQYWHREIDRAITSLNALRQAAVSGQDMEHLQRIETTRRNIAAAIEAGDPVWVDAEQAILDSLQRGGRR